MEGPDQYSLAFDKKSCRCVGESEKFTGRAAERRQKLYVVAIAGRPEYVGITNQPMASRLRLGFKASGENGYHGYGWRHKHTRAELFIWYHDNRLDLETIEAEVVYLIRQQGQWPACQTEIHFHPSNAEHRALAASILAHFTPEPSLT